MLKQRTPFLQQHNVIKGDFQIKEDCGTDGAWKGDETLGSGTEGNGIWASDFMWNELVGYSRSEDWKFWQMGLKEEEMKMGKIWMLDEKALIIPEV